MGETKIVEVQQKVKFISAAVKYDSLAVVVFSLGIQIHHREIQSIGSFLLFAVGANVYNIVHEIIIIIIIAIDLLFTVAI